MISPALTIPCICPYGGFAILPLRREFSFEQGTQSSFLVFIQLASIRIWLRHLNPRFNRKKYQSAVIEGSGNSGLTIREGRGRAS
jgi:hypothetical protein